MTDFIKRLYDHLTVRGQEEARVRVSEITKISLGFVADELGMQYKQFQKGLGKVSEKAKEKLNNFSE
jgi:uncharacterized protein (DUF2164 family)